MSLRLDLTSPALARSRLVIFAAIAIFVGGLFLFAGFPAQEEPDVPVNQAVVTAYFPNLPPERMEAMVARPVEAAVRDVPEVEDIFTTVRAGFVFIRVELRQDVASAGMPIVWQRLRAKLRGIEPTLPPGTQGPFLDDDFGRVAVASIAITAPGFTIGELSIEARRLRDRLATLAGADRVTLHGLTAERVTVEIDTARLAATGLTYQTILAALQRQNIIEPGGALHASGLVASVDPTSGFDSVAAVRDALVPAVGGALIRLGDLARIARAPVDPPDVAALYNGGRAAVLAVGMEPGRNIATFGEALEARVGELQRTLPAGFALHFVTFQPEVVADATGEVRRTLYETLGIVMLIVVLFLGLRTGLIVGAIVPLTILATLILMSAAGIPFHNVSLATIIIALGLLVDNGIVIAEDVERRLAAGEERRAAATEAGATLAIPLLVSSLTIIFAFLPLVLARSNTAEYARSMSIVIAMALLSSWVLAITVTPLLCARFAKAHRGARVDEDAGYARSRFYRGYRRLLEGVLARHMLFTLAMGALLVLALWELGRVPFELTPNSTRPQYQITVELPANASAARTVATLERIGGWLKDARINPEIRDHIAYAGDTGPRFILALNPPDPAPNRGYIVVNLHEPEGLGPAVARARASLDRVAPDARIEAKPFSYGATEAGLVVYRLVGDEPAILLGAAERLRAAFAMLPGARDVRTDAEAGVTRARVTIDDQAALRAGLTRADIAQALGQLLGDSAIGAYREADRVVPIVLQGTNAQRAGALGGLMLFPPGGGAPVPLGAVARIEGVGEPGVINRYNQQRAVTLSGTVTGMTADQVVARLRPEVDRLDLPPEHRIVFGGELLESQRANGALLGPLPLCFLLMLAVLVWQFDSFRKVLIIVATIPFCVLGVAVGLAISGEPLSFMGLLGLLSLAGIIVNNAILLIERIDAERAEGKPPRDALLAASVKRLRPIIMTKLVCVLGLVPLYIFGGPLWRPLAVVIMGGLTLGSLVTLGLVPVLYAWLFRVPFTEPEAKA